MPPFLRHKNHQLTADLTPLVEAGLEATYLTADVASGASTITVRDIDGFAVDQYLLIGELGQEASEIIKLHASSAPSGTTITLAANTAFAHAAGTRVYRVEYNQIEWSHSATIGGSKSTLATANIQADQLVQSYIDISQTSGYYFARFKNASATTYSSYSDGVPYGGFAATTVGYAIAYALKRNGLDSYAGDINAEFCFQETNDCINEMQGSQLRWAEHFLPNYTLGELSAGTPSVSLPADIYDDNSNKSLLAVRIGAGEKLTYVDPILFEEAKIGEIRTQVATQQTSGQTTLVVDDASDFADEGTLDFYVSGTKYSVSYTAVNRSTNTFSGIPTSGIGAISVTIPVDTYIYQLGDFGEPQRFTVRNGVIEFDPVPDVTVHQKNAYADYWTVATSVDSEGDELDVQRFDMIKYWLAWKVRMQLKNEGALNLEDGFYLKYKERLNQAIRNAPRHIKYPYKPKINRIRYR